MVEKLSPEERLQRTVAGDAAIIALLARAVGEKYGAEGLATLREAIEKEFPRMFAHVGRQLGARVAGGDATDWANIESYVSGMGGTVVQVEAKPDYAVLRVTSCPRADQFKRVFPDFCRLVWCGMEKAIGAAVNPRLVVRTTRTIPSGDEYCEVVCEMR